MLKKDALKFYKTGNALAKAIGVSRQYIYQWGDVVPIHSAMLIEEHSKGAVKVKKKLYMNGAAK